MPRPQPTFTCLTVAACRSSHVHFSFSMPNTILLLQVLSHFSAFAFFTPVCMAHHAFFLFFFFLAWEAWEAATLTYA